MVDGSGMTAELIKRQGKGERRTMADGPHGLRQLQREREVDAWILRSKRDRGITCLHLSLRQQMKPQADII